MRWVALILLAVAGLAAAGVRLPSNHPHPSGPLPTVLIPPIPTGQR